MQYNNWKELTPETSNKINEIKTGQFHEIEITEYKNDFGQMNNISTIYTSAYPAPETIKENELSATGEVITKRNCENIDKYDLYLIGITNERKLVYSGPFKKIPEHHVKPNKIIKIEKLFGKINKSKYKNGFNRIKSIKR